MSTKISLAVDLLYNKPK